jgi:hypothetical protein
LFVKSGTKFGIQSQFAELLGVVASELPTIRFYAPAATKNKR